MADLKARLRSLLPAFLVFATSFAGLLLLERHALSTTPFEPGYLHPWSSDRMMQAIPVADLKASPLRSLFCLDRQPPALNVLRAAIAAFLPAQPGSPELLRQLDSAMLVAWAVLYAALNTLVFSWLRFCTGSFALAGGGVLVWALLPAPLHFSVLLEGTLLSSLAVTWLLYELHRSLLSRDRPLLLAFAAATAFYVRSVFQWYFFPLLVLAARLGGMPWPAASRLALACLLLAAPLLVKQQVFTGTLATSTYEGDHKLGLVWYRPSQEEVNALMFTGKPPEVPASGTVGRWVFEWCPAHPQAFPNQVNLQIFNRWVKENPSEALAGVAKSVALNGKVFWYSSALSNADHLAFLSPIFRPGVWLFSHWRLQALVALSLLLWLLRALRAPLEEKNRALRRGAAFALVVGYIVAILHLANRYEWTETERLKFFLEPAFFVFLISEAYAAGAVLFRRLFVERQSKR